VPWTPFDLVGDRVGNPIPYETTVVNSSPSGRTAVLWVVDVERNNGKFSVKLDHSTLLGTTGESVADKAKFCPRANPDLCVEVGHTPSLSQLDPLLS
jgi:hypothetical protein